MVRIKIDCKQFKDNLLMASMITSLRKEVDSFCLSSYDREFGIEECTIVTAAIALKTMFREDSDRGRLVCKKSMIEGSCKTGNHGWYS